MRCTIRLGTMSMCSEAISERIPAGICRSITALSHPDQCGVVGIRERDTYTLFKEIYHTGLTIDDVLAKMDRMLQRESRYRDLDNIFTDHDAEHNERLERAGYGVTLAIKDILPGIDVVKKAPRERDDSI